MNSVLVCSLVIFSLSFLSCSRSGVDELTFERVKRSKLFKEEIISELTKASKVYIVEHSYMFDFPDEPFDSQNWNYIEYRRLELSDDQISEIIDRFRNMHDGPKLSFSMCSFAPHHRIEIFYPDKLPSYIEVCFKCGDTEWADTKGLAPEAFQTTFQDFIEPMGFSSDRNWYELAKSLK